MKFRHMKKLQTVQVFAIHSTMWMCRLYSKPHYFRFTVISLHLKQQVAVKVQFEYSEKWDTEKNGFLCIEFIYSVACE